MKQLTKIINPINSLPNQTQELIASYWAGPYTFLLPTNSKNKKIYKNSDLTGKHDLIAVRLTAHSDAQKICNLAGMAIVSTSANKSGKKSLTTYKSCLNAFKPYGIKILKGKIGKRKRPSTIIHGLTGAILRA